MKNIVFCLLAAVGLLMAACQNDRVTGVTLDQYDLSINVGESKTLTATVIPENAIEQTVYWYSERPEIATVNNGRVTGVSPGNTSIRVSTKDGEYYRYCYVTVSPGSSTFDGKITAQVVNGNQYNTTIRRVRSVIYDSELDEDVTLTSVNYTNGGFTMTLPTPAARYLVRTDSYFDDSGIDISKVNVKLLIIESFEGFGSTSGGFNYDDWVDDFILGKVDGNLATIAIYIYADGDVTISGSDDWTNYSLSLKRGWNIVYYTERLQGKDQCTTTAVSGLKWYTEQDLDNMITRTGLTKKFVLISEN